MWFRPASLASNDPNEHAVPPEYDTCSVDCNLPMTLYARTATHAYRPPLKQSTLMHWCVLQHITHVLTRVSSVPTEERVTTTIILYVRTSQAHLIYSCCGPAATVFTKESRASSSHLRECGHEHVQRSGNILCATIGHKFPALTCKQVTPAMASIPTSSSLHAAFGFALGIATTPYATSNNVHHNVSRLLFSTTILIVVSL